MIDRTTKLRWRRRVKQRQKIIEGLGSQTEEHIDKHFFRRLGRLYEVRRFLFAWILLLVALIGAVVVQTRALGDYYLKLVPVSGGIFAEGMIGSYTNANPIFASNDVDSSVSKLLFSGLLTYNSENNLVKDLAEDWGVDETGKVYTVKLREDIKWHDGERLTASDVVFTFRSVQNPDTRSPYFASWQGISIEAVNDYEVMFTLPNILASFPYSLTMGILPKHKLESVQPSDLRGSLFNTVEPVGTGPFKWNGVEVIGDTAKDREQRISLAAFADYHFGRPKLDEFIIRAFLDETTMITSFENGRLNAISGATSMPLGGNEVEELNIPLTGSVMIFFNTGSEILKETKVRQALNFATDKSALVKSLAHKSVPVESPLLPEHIGYSPKYLQRGFNVGQANKLLDEAGWKMENETGIRAKGDKKLKLMLNTLSSAEYAGIASQLQKYWRSIGVELNVNSLGQEDLQTAIDNRTYDALIYGIVMGSDPDQFAYWHSSQADARSQRRLNFSDYKSEKADSALEAGRTRIDSELRAAKYLPFLQAWRDDVPAIALYRPRYIYTVYGNLYNFNVDGMNSPVDRFNNVHEWMIRTDRAVQ